MAEINAPSQFKWDTEVLEARRHVQTAPAMVSSSQAGQGYIKVMLQILESNAVGTGILVGKGEDLQRDQNHLCVFKKGPMQKALLPFRYGCKLKFPKGEEGEKEN